MDSLMESALNKAAGKKLVSEKESPAHEKSMVMHFETSDGKKGDLHWENDMLASVGGTGGTVNAKYHESSTEEDPVAVIWGTDWNGKEYKKLIHLNDINPSQATPAEMIALNAHLSKKDSNHTENPIALWVSGRNGVNSKMDYEQYYKEYISMQQQGGNQSSVDLYQLQLERFLFFYQQNKKTENTRI
ncbi:hypothetical protein AALB16_07655 [Lachnospiraceae bacterium 62-35]